MTPEIIRTENNRKRLLLISPSIRPRVAAVIAELEAEGKRPMIDGNVYRTPREQLDMVRRGVSKAKWGFHCATTADGKADALAADIVDADLGWKAPRSYWIALGAAAKKCGLNWGGYFGIKNGNMRASLDLALRERNDSEKIALGWDPSHVEVLGISTTMARLGKRPPMPGFIPSPQPRLVPDNRQPKQTTPKPTGAVLTLAPTPTNQPATNPQTTVTAPAKPSEVKPEQSLLESVPVNDTTKAVAGSVAQKAAVRVGGPLTTLWAALQAGNVYAILGVAVAVIGLGLLIYFERRAIARGIRRLFAKFQGEGQS